MKKVKIVIILADLGVPNLIREILKENFPGLVDELKFGKRNEIELSSFLEIPYGQEMIILASNPFRVKDYPSINGSQDFETWINEKVGEICVDEYAVYFAYFQISEEKDLYEKSHTEEIKRIFRELDLFKTIKTNMPGPLSFKESYGLDDSTASIFK